MDTKWNIEKLGEGNYETWRFQVMHYLKGKNLWKYVQNAPAADDDVNQRQKTFSLLVVSVKPCVLYVITSCADAHEAWNALEGHFRSSTTASKLYLKKTYFRCVMKDTDTLEEHLKQMKTMTDKLAAVGCTVAEEDQVATLLGSLPARFTNIVTALEARLDDLTLSFTKQALQNEEQKQGDQNSLQKADSVMKLQPKTKSHSQSTDPAVRPKTHHDNNSQGQGHGKTHENGNKSKVVCYHCGKVGHYKSKCWQLRRDSTKASVSSEGSSLGDTAFRLNAVSSSSGFDGGELLVDCGATSHIVRDKTRFISFDETFNPKDHFMELADGTRKTGVAEKRGEAVIGLIDRNGQTVSVTLHNALWVPTYPLDIFSVQRATENGGTVNFGSEESVLTSSNGKQFPIVHRDRLFFLPCIPDVSHVNLSNNDVVDVACAESLQDWHRKLGHCNTADLLKLQGVVNGLEIGSRESFSCETCVQAKQCNSKGSTPRTRAEHVLDLVHTDLSGPITPTGKYGYRYVIIFTDDYSGYHFCYLLKHKNDATMALKLFIADARPYGNVKVVRSDGGTEFTGSDFRQVLVDNGIKFETSAPYSPHQNGVAERTWRTVYNMARAMLFEAGLSKSFWIFAVRTAVYVRNRCFNRRTGQTPLFLMTGKVPDLSKLQAFGTKCFAHDPQPKGKFESRCTEGIFVGMAKRNPAYMIYVPGTGAIIERRVVTFSEAKDKPPKADVEECSVELADDDGQGGAQKGGAPEATLEGDAPRYPARERKAPAKFDDYVMLNDYMYTVAASDAPASFAEAQESNEATAWQEAMNAEMAALNENATWELKPLPEGRSPIGSRWVYARKLDKNGHVDKHKARLVAKGYSQVEGEDYSETFSPTVRMTTIRTMVQCAVNHDWLLNQMDVKSAYLNAEIDHDVYMEQPEGYQVTGNDGQRLYCHLRKSLYGLKQSGRLWNDVLKAQLTAYGFKQSQLDTCLYMYEGGARVARVAVFVDDLIIASNDLSLMDEIKSMLHQKFKMTDLGQLSWFLGIEFERGPDFCSLNQSQYLENLLKKHGMSECKPVSTPCIEKPDFDDDELTDVPNELYRSIVGSLVYAVTCTRPDLCWVVSKLSQYLNEPVTKNRWMAVKRVLRYVQGTKAQRLYYRKSKSELTGFCDASWGEVADRKSTTGFCFTMSQSETAMLVWRSKKQSCVALSSCEAEYLAMANAVQEGVFLRQLLLDVDVIDSAPCFVLRCDNQGAIALAQKGQVSQRSKHIDVKVHFVRQHVSSGDVELKYLCTTDMVADCLTKPLGKQLFEKFRKEFVCE